MAKGSNPPVLLPKPVWQQHVVAALCVLHMLAILWWTVPQHFPALQADGAYDATPVFDLEQPLLDAARLDLDSAGYRVLRAYIGLTASEQNWDFFAPAAPHFHQYLSVCAAVKVGVLPEQLQCVGATGFSTLQFGFKGWAWGVADDSRWYRLTENLLGLNDTALLRAFSRYYQSPGMINDSTGHKPVLIMHQFELFPGLQGMPSEGYRVDSQRYPVLP